MKFTCTVTINQPIGKVVAYFANPNNLKEYQTGFIKKELISGIEGQKGAIAKMYYEQGKRPMEITETVLENSLPNRFLGHYHHIHMDNTMQSNFSTTINNQTRYDVIIEYTEFRGFMPKTLAYLFPSMFKKQVQKWLDNFKVFVEKSES